MDQPERVPETRTHNDGNPAGPEQEPSEWGETEFIGRYRVERELGRGGNGIVYLARDAALQRLVAIKVPFRRRLLRAQDVDAYLREARVIAQLDHPAIVPVYDFGREESGRCYIVSKFIEGRSLADVIRQSPLSYRESAELVAEVAEALHHAHCRGVIHRDVKPSNILVDTSGRPFLTDFGVALKEGDFSKPGALTGTLPYMSPEQARGEGHRLDGRSDIFSLCATFYEMLTGRRPFRAASPDQLLKRIAAADPRPPRQIQDDIPKELERICLKGLSKRVADRYPTARDLADDLRQCLMASALTPSAELVGKPTLPATPSAPSPATPSDTESDLSVKVLPRGLRPYDAGDADYFLHLLPGPRDREGLPESVRFWKHRIDPAQGTDRFTVGLIYGPSGCGKTSLVKAGLLPALPADVAVIYVEAATRTTETRLRTRLYERFPRLPEGLNLTDIMTALRREPELSEQRSVLIVLDQFEQWLHAGRGDGGLDLVGALRQCDGRRLQCLILVRDDFWLAASRFMRELEVPIVEGHNSAMVDLFDPRHAKRVLAGFGRALGCLPEPPQQLAKEHHAFLDQSVSALAEGGKVICVRLALFAEMMKSRPWVPATLKAIGGATGIGVTFLEETFASPAAPTKYRTHQAAVRRVLKTLLAEARIEIRGQARSRRQLLEASGYAQRPRDFDELVQILDQELRLLTPAEPEQINGEGASAIELPPEDQYYQLAHDYLVPAVREWVREKQKATRSGRAEIRLAERTRLWSAKPEPRQLPSFWEWLNIRLFTRPALWSGPERDLMRAAAKQHLRRGAALAVLVLAIAWGSMEAYARYHAASLVDRLIVADTADVPRVIEQMEPLRRWVDPRLRSAMAASRQGPPSSTDAKTLLHASLALLPSDAAQADYLRRRILAATPAELRIVRDALEAHRESLIEDAWRVVADLRGPRSARFRAACALAAWDTDSPRWPDHAPEVAGWLVSEAPPLLNEWIEILHPVREAMIPALRSLVAGTEDRNSHQHAVFALCEWLRHDAAALVDLNRSAHDAERSIVARRLREHGDLAIELLQRELAQTAAADASEAAKEAVARRQAAAALALVLLDRPEATWPLLAAGEDPRLRTYLIHGLAPAGVDPATVIRRLVASPDASVRKALLLALGKYDPGTLGRREREETARRLIEMYQEDPDSGIHAAARWLLRRWGREEELVRVETELRGRGPEGNRNWYHSREGHMMVIVRGPVSFWMGASPNEPDQRHEEKLHRQVIPATFAIAAMETTLAQFRRFRPDYDRHRQTPAELQCPVNRVNYDTAMAYCQWLSQQEGIAEDQMCYEVGPDGGLKPRPDCLTRTGYRLPTEFEWEYACRAGTRTYRHYGYSDELLGAYAWYFQNSLGRPHPVGLLMPNDFGLFDVYGNALEWCQNAYGTVPKHELGDGGLFRVVRGSSFLGEPSRLRSAERLGLHKDTPTVSNGFRVARTLDLSNPTRKGSPP